MENWERRIKEVKEKYKFHSPLTKKEFKQKLVELEDKEHITIVAGCGLEYGVNDNIQSNKNDHAMEVWSHLQGCYENVVSVY